MIFNPICSMIFNLKHDWQAAGSDDNELLLRKVFRSPV